MRDVIIVGAGPAGSQTAYHLANEGLDVLLVEEHEQVGSPIQCAGLFTPPIFDMAPVDLEDVHQNTVYGAHIYAPDGHMLDIRSDEPASHAIERDRFDYLLSRAAADAGAELREGTKVMDARRVNGHVEVELVADGGADGSYTESARLMVGADGVQSRVAKWFGLPSSREVLPCYGAEMTGIRADDPEYVEMFLGEERAPGFFSWIIPTNEAGTRGKVEIGVGMKEAERPSKWYWEKMFSDPLSEGFLPEPEEEYGICGCIPLGVPRRSTADNVALIGDAASMAKPTTGGGVYMSLRASEHLRDAVVAAFEADDLSRKRLSAYHDAWMGDIGRELKIGWRMRKAFLRLNDEQITELFHIMDDPEILATINAVGDIDYPSELAKALIKKAPQLFKYTPTFVRSLFD